MKHHLPRFARGAMVAGSLFMFACGGGDDNETPDGGTTTEPSYTGTYNHYVTNSFKVGMNASEARSYGFALDNEPPMLDNQIGATLANFGAQLMLDAEIAVALSMGEFIILHSVRADDLTSDSSVSWQVFLGEPKMNPVFDGSGEFTVQASSPTTARLGGSISGGKFTTNPAYARELQLDLSLAAGQAPLRVTLQSPRIEATINATTCSGKLGGAIKVADLDTNIIPFLANQMNAYVAPCREGNTAGCTSNHNIVLGLFDTNNDKTITAAEVKDNDIVKGILAPDVDVLKADGTPGTDGMKESVSIGMGFGCVKASFTAPGEGS
jgi:hypothetical protein